MLSRSSTSSGAVRRQAGSIADEDTHTMATPDPLVIADRTFTSRLIVGTGKYSSFAVMAQAHEAAGAEMVTVAVRRVNINDRGRESLLDYIDTNRRAILPNTAACFTAGKTIRTGRPGPGGRAPQR